MRCDLCAVTAVIDQPYRGAHLCESHLRASVDERVVRELRVQAPRFPGGTVAVALSGGKDSVVALFLVQRYFAGRANVRLVAITIDEGIQGYRGPTLAKARELTARLGVDHRVVSARDLLGVTTDEAARELPTIAPCSFCGVWRRRLLNTVAREEGAALLVLGFNLDDLAQTVLMNLAHGDLDHLLRMAPHRVRQPGLVPRIAPLAKIPEREVFVYARSRALPFDHGECPHAGRAARNVFRQVVWQLEEASPGTRHALLRTRDRVAALLAPENGAGAPGRCRSCGEPAAADRCRACEYLDTVRGSVMPTPVS